MKMRNGASRTTPVPRRVWRITAAAPHGEFVDEDSKAVPAPHARSTASEAELASGVDKTWRASSFDLAKGAVVDDLSDSIPGELFDELFGSAKPPAPGNLKRKGEDGR